jgi:SAM-dependent methyltransferase
MDYNDANRIAWNAGEEYHREAVFDLVLHKLKTPGLLCLDEYAVDALTRIDVSGKTVAQLCCNNGRELMSVLKLGASRGVGFDISDKFIQQGKELAEKSGIECELIACDVLEIEASYHGQFDLVMITVGALGWFQDLTVYFGKVSELLKPGGELYIYEQHPFTEMLDLNASIEAPRLTCDYFRTEPYRDLNGLDYYSGIVYDSPPSYWFVHTFSIILQACIDQGLIITSIEEFEHDISNNWPELDEADLRLPLCYMLMATK